MVLLARAACAAPPRWARVPVGARALATSPAVRVEAPRTLPPSTHTVPQPDSLFAVPSPQPPAPSVRGIRRKGMPITQPQALKRQRQILSQFEKLGSTQNPKTVWRPAKAYKSPKEAQDVTLSQLFAAGAHIGHDKSQTLGIYHPYLVGWRNGQAVIDVENFTLPALKRAAAVVRKTVAADGLVLFVGTAPGMEKPVEAAVERMWPNGYMYVNKHWTAGSLSNAEIVQGPKVANMLATAKLIGDRASANTTELATKAFKPDLVVILNPGPNAGAAAEATSMRIPSIAIVDSNMDPRMATYAIPGNDESPRFTALVAGVLARAGEQGLAEKARHLRHYEPHEVDAMIASERPESETDQQEQTSGDSDLYEETRAARSEDRKRRARR